MGECCESTIGRIILKRITRRKFRNFEAIRFLRRHRQFPDANKSLQKSVIHNSGKIFIVIFFSIFHLSDFLEYTRCILIKPRRPFRRDIKHSQREVSGYLWPH